MANPTTPTIDSATNMYDITLRKLKKCAKNEDIEMAHLSADHAVMDFLRSLGYDDLAKAFYKVPRWYA